MDREHQESDTISDDARSLLSSQAMERNQLLDYVDQLTTLNARLAPDGTILLINATAARVSGMSPSELVGRKFWELPHLGHSKDKQARIRSVVKEVAAGKAVRLEVTHPTVSGDFMTVDISVTPVMDTGGRVSYLVAEGRDITKRKLVEDALEESEEKYRTLFEAANDAIFLMDYDRFIDCNSKTLQMFGCTRRDQVVGHSVMDFSPEKQPDGQTSIDKAIERIRDALSGSPQFFEWKHTHLDGSPFNAEVSLHAVEIHDVMRLQAIVRDITSRKQAEERLRDSEQRYRGFSQAAFEGLMIHSQGVLVDCNQVFAELFGYESPEQLIGKDALALPLTPESRVTIERQLREQKDHIFEVSAVLPDGTTHILETQGRAITYRGRSARVVAMRDITERKQVEREKREFYRETIRSVTGGKLDITDRTAIECYEARSSIVLQFARAGELSHSRQQAEAYCASKGLQGDSLALFIVGLGEAMTNALKHASGGRVFWGFRDDELYVGVADTGMGIATLTLPHATLERGYSTKVSMGMGYSIILDVADRVMLNTGPEGTTVVMFKSLLEASPEVSLDCFRDTWDDVPTSA